MNFFRTTAGVIIGALMMIGLGIGIVFGIQWYRNKEARDAVLSKPAIAENKAQLDSQEVVVRSRNAEYQDAASVFRSSAATTLKSPTTSPQARHTIEQGKKAVDKADSLQTAKDSVIRLLYRRDTLLTEEAVRARRGKFLQGHAALGYAPYVSAPAARLGLDVNISEHWGITATKDVAVKYRMNNGKPKTEWLTTDFIGVNYRF